MNFKIQKAKRMPRSRVLGSLSNLLGTLRGDLVCTFCLDKYP
jgi:hypothetical protein